MPDTNFVEEVRARTDLVLLAEAAGAQHRGGKTLKMLCVWHAEDSPSLVIWPDQQRWKCFGACDEGGDVFAWVMKRDNVDFFTALTTLAEAAGLEMPARKEQSPEEKEQRSTASELLEMAASYYHECLLRQPGAQAHRDYLTERGFGDEELWQRWQVGAAGNKNGLLALFQARKVSLSLAAKVGLLGISKTDSTYYDWFRDRIVIPFIEGGRVTFFTGRAIAEQPPKYLHLANTEYAHKTPYNYRASGKELIIVEGPLDVWAAEALCPDKVSVLALMGLGHGDPLLTRTMARRDKVYIGLDADGTVTSRIVEDCAALAGAEKAHLLRWPSGDDAAAWAKQGATVEQFEALLKAAPSWLDELLLVIENEELRCKPQAVEKAVSVAATLSLARGDGFIAAIKKAARGVVQAATINKLIDAARKTDQEDAASPDAGEDFYRNVENELWAGHGESAHKITLGGIPVYTEAVTVDDGENCELELTMEVRLTSGRVYTTRVPSGESGDEGKLIKYIKEVAGPFLTIGANQKKHMPPGVESVSRMAGLVERVEIAHTGWIDTKTHGLAYCTPGGVVGELPPGHSVALPKGLSEGFGIISVADAGDEAFEQGLDGLLNAFLEAFEPNITYPLLAFALLPVAARWLPKRKFAMHLSGETGSLKTATAKTVMSLYGGAFAGNPPLMSWRSTMNAVEMAGFWLPDMLGLVDDYKPSIVKPWDFTELIQRYADGNARIRLSSNSELRRKQSMRWWLLSTGEDIPVGESSVLARMVTIRFPRRPQGMVFNAELAKAQRLAVHFPTITARWAAWLRDNQENLGMNAAITMHHQSLGRLIQSQVAGAPNASRVAENLATLKAVWSVWLDFLTDTGLVPQKRIVEYGKVFGELVQTMAVEAAQQVADEKPTKLFLETVQSGLDSGRFYLNGRAEANVRGQGFLGYHDSEGIYLLPASYNEVSRWLRESGQQIGFHQKELYRLLTEEGLLARHGQHETTVVVKIGGKESRATTRALHLKPDVLSVRAVEVPAPIGMLS